MSLLLHFQTQGLREMLYLQFLTSETRAGTPKIPRRELTQISISTDQDNPFDENMLTQNFSHATQKKLQT